MSNDATVTRELGGFERLELRDRANWVDLIIEPGEREALVIDGPLEILNRIKTEVQAGRNAHTSGSTESWSHYLRVMARCTNANMAMSRNRMPAEMVHPRPAFAATPSIPPVPAKNKTT